MSGWRRATVAGVLGGLGLVLWGLGPSPWPEVFGLPLVLAGLFWGLVPLPNPLARAVETIGRRPSLSWGLPLLLVVAAVAVVYHSLLAGHMPWAAGQADHPTHQYQAWLFVERMLPSGRITGWSDLRWAGYPALELYPIGGPIWVALWRLLTLGLLDWEATYALAILAMVAANVVATYLATRRFGGPVAAALAAALVLFERGWPRQGGDHYAIDVGVWPVTMGIGPTLLCLERQWSWLAERSGPAALVAACALAGWALLCHPMYLPVLVLAAPCLVAVALVRRVPSDRAVAGAVVPLLAGFLLAGFWYLPFLAHGHLSEPGGAPFRSLSNLGEGIAMATVVPRFWTPALVLALVGAITGLARRGGIALVAVLSVLLILAASSTPLEVSAALADLSVSVQQERFMIPLRVLLCVLAGSGAAAILEVALGHVERWGVRQKLAAAGLILLTAPLAASAVEGLVKHLAVPVVELEQGDDLEHRRDLLALCRWLRTQADEEGAGPPERTAWYVGYGHHEYNNAPIYCGLAQIIDSPAETFSLRPGGISEREVRAFGVRWVIGDRPIEGRDHYLELVRRFGALHVYEVRGELSNRVTVLGPGRAEVEHFGDELIRVRIQGAGERTRLAVHVSRYPNWEATVNGRPVRISGGHLGLPRADLIHVPVSDGVLELRWERGPIYWIGILCTVLALLALVFAVLFRRVPALRRRFQGGRVVALAERVPRPARAAVLGLVGLGALGLIMTQGGRAETPTGEDAIEVAPSDSLAGELHRARVWVVTGGEREHLRRRWDGRFGRHWPPEVIVDRHVEALELGDPRRVVAVRVGSDEEEVHLRFPISVRGLRGSLARGGRGRGTTELEVWLGHRRLERLTHDRLGEWLTFEAVAAEPASPLELVIRAAGQPGRAVLVDAAVVR